MVHFAHSVSVNRLQIPARIGFYTGERGKPQPIEVCFRLFYAAPPLAARDDHAPFIDYGMLSKKLIDFVAAHEFKLIEFLGSELFRVLRMEVDSAQGTEVKLWLRLNKISAPVPGLIGGASFETSDLPAHATYTLLP